MDVDTQKKMSLSWESLDRKNHELSTLIETRDIAAPSPLHDHIRDNAALMYQEYNTPPSHYTPGDRYWDEYAQLPIGSDPPPHLDPHNIAYYHYRKLQDDELLQREFCIDSSIDERDNNDDNVCDDEDDDAGFVDGSSDNSDDGKENSTNTNNGNEDDNDDYERATLVVVKR